MGPRGQWFYSRDIVPCLSHNVGGGSLVITLADTGQWPQPRVSGELLNLILTGRRETRKRKEIKINTYLPYINGCCKDDLYFASFFSYSISAFADQ